MSHPNIHRLISVRTKPDPREFSMISEMMENGDILQYVRKSEANRICLVRVSVASALLRSDR